MTKKRGARLPSGPSKRRRPGLLGRPITDAEVESARQEAARQLEARASWDASDRRKKAASDALRVYRAAWSEGCGPCAREATEIAATGASTTGDLCAVCRELESAWRPWHEKHLTRWYRAAASEDHDRATARVLVERGATCAAVLAKLYGLDPDARMDSAKRKELERAMTRAAAELYDDVCDELFLLSGYSDVPDDEIADLQRRHDLYVRLGAVGAQLERDVKRYTKNPGLLAELEAMAENAAGEGPWGWNLDPYDWDELVRLRRARAHVERLAMMDKP